MCEVGTLTCLVLYVLWKLGVGPLAFGLERNSQRCRWTLLSPQSIALFGHDLSSDSLAPAWWVMMLG